MVDRFYILSPTRAGNYLKIDHLKYFIPDLRFFKILLK